MTTESSCNSCGANKWKEDGSCSFCGSNSREKKRVMGLQEPTQRQIEMMKALAGVSRYKEVTVIVLKDRSKCCEVNDESKKEFNIVGAFRRLPGSVNPYRMDDLKPLQYVYEEGSIWEGELSGDIVRLSQRIR